MQGRLSPKYKGRYQAFPVGFWEKEFHIAKKLGVELIEFILDLNDIEQNPLIRKGGIKDIKSVIKKTGVEVHTICADYLMEAPLHSDNNDIVQTSKNILLNLIDSASHLCVTDIIIPCVDQSALKNQDEINRFIKNLTPALNFAEKKCINLSLETDLPPEPFFNLLNCFKSSRITVNYDIGNSASMGYNFAEELAAYGSHITDIHIKDRIKNGGSVLLGQGNADFQNFFIELEKYHYQGPFIMQAFRDDEGVKLFKNQLEWIKKYIDK